MKLAFKVDVDTYEGMKYGVPNLLKLFRELNIKVSFFVPFGPDESGKAIFRVFKKKGFVTKMFRTNPLKLYGIKTMLRGTLMPAPIIGSSFPEIVKQIISEGHELGIHGYNHVLWQDHLLEMDEKKVREHFDSGISAFEKIVGKKPNSFAAPAWLCSPLSLKMLDEFQFTYASDTRGRTPFLPSMNGEKFKTLQAPSTLPTLDELLGLNGLNENSVGEYLNRQMMQSNLDFHVHSIHTEVEGTALFNSFSKWVQELKEKNIAFVKIADVVETILKEPQKIPKCEIELSEIMGRAGKVACQKI